MSGIDAATLAQHFAARPAHSTWLSANAGSGKTRVLTDRAARLLLGGTAPDRILCLTYTKAAASEMQNRLFARLGEWAMLDDRPLSEALAEIGVQGEIDLDHARTLFARAIETPGGLKIQTIHSFCAAILRRFPVEAGVSPQFTEIDEHAAARLIGEVIEAIADAPGGAVLEEVAQWTGGDSLEGLAGDVLGQEEAFDPPLGEAEIRSVFGLPPDFGEAALAAGAFAGDEAAILSTVIPALRAGKATDQKNANRLAAFAGRELTAAGIPALERVFLTQSGTNAGQPKTGGSAALPLKEVREALGADVAPLHAWMQRIADTRPRRLALAAARRTAALHRFAAAFLPRYRAAKDDRGLLDFNDLIARTRRLLSDAPSAAWVLYKLDGGIDHILVDEAQDTSPAQWDVIAKLTEEMTAGEGRPTEATRTLFVVGDKKQSIYSFQGADPEAFDHMAGHFSERLANRSPVTRTELVHSFRSSPAILEVVDRVYGPKAGPQESIRHLPFFAEMPGRVDLWPLVPAPEKPREPEWWQPVDLTSKDHHSVVLAEAIARFVSDSIATGTLPVKGGHRPIHAGDFIILVQSRKTPLFHNLIRALKTHGVPVAGADRLRLASELAVKDLLSVLRFLALPEDDLALAEALRSPIVGLSEAALYDLAHGRPGYLWAALRERRADYPEAHALLSALRNRADFLRPYELIEEILTRHGGRSRLIARLGREAEDGIDMLLAQALSYEMSEVPSLTGFLVWSESGEAEIKRQADQAGRQLRVMTVHGAKGLESPVVILPDTLKQEARVRDELLLTPGGVPVWRKGSAADLPPPLSEAHDAAMAADAAERARLLYVAMTRAEKWLVVCGSGTPPKDGCWYGDVEAGLETLETEVVDTPAGPGRRFAHGDWEQGPVAADPRPVPAMPGFPGWVDADAPAPRHPPRPVSPSSLPGEKSLPGEGEDRDQALARGSALHLLLEHLPQRDRAEWPGLAAALVSDPGLDPAGLLDEARRLIEDPALAVLFGPDALPEVPFAAELAELGHAPVEGAIDRLVIGDHRILVVDFKSNAVVPETAAQVPVGLLRQLGAYAAGLAQIYPGRRIDTAILWTRTGALMECPHALVMEALQSTPPP